MRLERLKLIEYFKQLKRSFSESNTRYDTRLIYVNRTVYDNR